MKVRIPARSYFDRSHTWTGSMDMGYLVPVCCDEVYPGDTYRDRSETLVRFEAMIKPMMHEFNVTLHWFFVRDWTIMDGFEEMIYAGVDGESDVTVPFNSSEVTIAQGSLGDYLNINPGVYAEGYFSMLPFRVYNKIYNDWYRNMYTEPDEVDLDSMVLQKRCWERDMFTAGTPYAQRGPAVALPLGSSAPVFTGLVNANVPNTQALHFRLSDGTNFDSGSYLMALQSSGNSGASLKITGTGTTLREGSNTPQPDNLYADLTQATAASVQSLWLAEQLQKWQMKNMVGGVRYVEGTKMHFGINTPDARVERAEYLGGGKSPVIITEVLQTSETQQSGTPQGNLAGHGISANITNGFKRTFSEHGFIMCIMSVMPRTMYCQGIDPMFFREDHLDFMTPEFSRLGYRPIPMKWLYTGAYIKNDAVVDPSTTGAVWTPTSDPDATFNYNAIYNELRYKPSTIHGNFRGNESYWTEARIFASTPAFNDSFVKCTPSKRGFAVPAEPGLKVQVLHHLEAFRELPKEGTPWSL